MLHENATGALQALKNLISPIVKNVHIKLCKLGERRRFQLLTESQCYEEIIHVHCFTASSLFLIVAFRTVFHSARDIAENEVSWVPDLLIQNLCWGPGICVFNRLSRWFLRRWP